MVVQSNGRGIHVVITYHLVIHALDYRGFCSTNRKGLPCLRLVEPRSWCWLLEVITFTTTVLSGCGRGNDVWGKRFYNFTVKVLHVLWEGNYLPKSWERRRYHLVENVAYLLCKEVFWLCSKSRPVERKGKWFVHFWQAKRHYNPRTQSRLFFLWEMQFPLKYVTPSDFIGEAYRRKDHAWASSTSWKAR